MNVHCLHDKVSRRLAQMIVDAIGGRVILEPTDTVQWSGIRIFDEESQRWVASVKWARGTPRDLDQAVHQLTKAVHISGLDEVHQHLSIGKLHEELGVELPRNRRRPTSGSL